MTPYLNISKRTGDVISFSVTKSCQKIQKIDENLWKLANIDREFLDIFWTTWVNSIKFSGNTLSLKDTLFEKPQEMSNWLHAAVLGSKYYKPNAEVKNFK